MKRTALKRKRARYPSPAQERYADCHGIYFDQYRLWLPERCSDWPTVVRVDDSQVCNDMHAWFHHCWNCKRSDEMSWQCTGWDYRPIEAHHLCAGTKGRSDEYTAIAMLCRDCHANANTAALQMGRILFLKWKFDRQHCDWVRLALLHRKHLPDLITDAVH